MSDEKAKLYQKVVQRASDHLMLSRMKMHGFWPGDLDLPPDPPEEVAERQEIASEMKKLQAEHQTTGDPKKALAEEQKRRWEESKKRRAEKKAAREAARIERRETWESTRKSTIIHAGIGVSAGLQARQSDRKKLDTQSLPILNDAPDLAKALEIPLARLRWLTYHRRGAATVHYHRYEISKKSGGARQISAPKPALAEAQNWILTTILERLDVHDKAHGFVRERSIKTNAEVHCAQGVVINQDLKDFFPTVGFRRVKGLFASFGYSEHMATLLALLCTEPPRAEIEFRGKTLHVALGDRVLPQGACTSPAITNLLCRRLDSRIAGTAAKYGFNYTRYADDLTFSASRAGDLGERIPKILSSVRKIVVDEGFVENKAKTRIMRPGSRQEVTGLAVNAERPTLSRAERRQLKATLHNAAKNGLESQNRDQIPNFAEHLQGKVAFACMVDPERAETWRERLERALSG